MLMPITYSEKTIFSKKSDAIAAQLLKLNAEEFENTVLLFKVLAHALRNNEAFIQQFDESIFENPEVLRKKFNDLLLHALNVAYTPSATAQERNQTTTVVKEYTPAQLAKYFGVSVMTIHNWLNQKRFVGIERVGDNKHNRIPDNTIFITSSGNQVEISEVVEMWNRQEAESALERNESELEYYTRLIANYEKKYKGEFERTLGAKAKLTPEEETDAEIWLHLLGRQRLEFRDKEK